MTIWILLTLMACLASAVLTIPLVRRYDNLQTSAAKRRETLEQQLAEVTRDQARGLLDEATAEQARLDINRRMLAAVRATEVARPLARGWRNAVVAAALVGVAVLATVTYARLGQPQLAPVQQSATAQADMPQAQGTALDTVDTMIARLEQRLQSTPDDAEGWRMLGWSYFSTQRYGEAAKAYHKAGTIDPANADYKASEAEALVQEQQGIVTPEAARIFADVIARDPANERARFYDALRLEQAGNLEQSFEAWAALLASAPAEASWRGEAMKHLEDLSAKTGKPVPSALTSPLPNLAPAAEGAVAPPISREDMTTIQNMPEGDQQAMINAMVERLASRLAENGNDPEGWARLLRARMVLQDEAGAAAAYAKAKAALANNPAGLASVTEAARALSIPTE